MLARSKKSLLRYAELVHQLYELCCAKATGTFFITAQDTCSAAFVLQEGKIIACNYGAQQGFNALKLFKTVETGTCVFVKNVFFSFQQLQLPNTEDILTFLGCQLRLPTEVHSGNRVMYRGAMVSSQMPHSDDVSLAENELQTTASEDKRSGKKSRLMYRGVEM